jgi:hypothetical protein
VVRAWTDAFVRLRCWPGLNDLAILGLTQPKKVTGLAVRHGMSPMFLYQQMRRPALHWMALARRYAFIIKSRSMDQPQCCLSFRSIQ